MRCWYEVRNTRMERNGGNPPRTEKVNHSPCWPRHQISPRRCTSLVMCCYVYFYWVFLYIIVMNPPKVMRTEPDKMKFLKKKMAWRTYRLENLQYNQPSGKYTWPTNFPRRRPRLHFRRTPRTLSKAIDFPPLFPHASVKFNGSLRFYGVYVCFNTAAVGCRPPSISIWLDYASGKICIEAITYVLVIARYRNMNPQKCWQ